MEKLPCEIVQDLLPSYTDGLTSEKTNRAVDAHLETCEICREIYHRMREPELAAPQEEKEIDFLKKVRKKRTKTAIISVLSALALVFVLLFAKIFWIGSPLDNASVACHVEVSGNTLTLEGDILSSGLEISRISCGEKDGVVTVQLRGVPVGSFYEGGLHYTYEAQEEITQVRLGNRVLWDRGVSISTATSALFDTAHDYVGDMSANQETAQRICALAGLGSFNSSLQTEEHPYGWTICLKSPVTKDDSLYPSACVLLSLVGNLDVLTFNYTMDGTEKTLTVTTEEASASYGSSIKAAAERPADLQKLLTWTGLIPENPAFWAITNQTELLVRNETGEGIYGFAYEYYDEDILLLSGGVMNADETHFAPGEVVNLMPDRDQPGVTLTVALFLMDEEGNQTPVSTEEPITLSPGLSYAYTLIRDSAGTYSLAPQA